MRTYIIDRGETPAIVAAKFGTTREDLYRANPHLPVVADRFGHREVYKGHWEPGNRINLPVSGSLGSPGTVGGTCSEIWGNNPPRQCVHSEYDVNAACIEMSKIVMPYAWHAGHDAGYQDGLRGYAGQYTVPSPPAWLKVPYAYLSESNTDNIVDLFVEGVQANWSDHKRYPCTVQWWKAWESGYMTGYAKGHAKGMQERQAAIAQGTQAIAALGEKARQSNVANSLADVAKAWQARRNAEAVAAGGAAAIRHAAQPNRATNYGPFTGRRPGSLASTSGNVGFRVPRLKGDPIPAGSVGWDSTHPIWPGSFLLFWSTRLHETLKNLTKANSAYDIAPLARRVSEQPDIEIKLNAWLRSKWTGPVQFIDANWSTTPTGANEWDVAMRGWMDADVVKVAKRAAAKYLDQLCMGAAGHPYNPYTGECSLSAGWNEEQVNDREITPETYVPRRRAPATGYGPFKGQRG